MPTISNAANTITLECYKPKLGNFLNTQNEIEGRDVDE